MAGERSGGGSKMFLARMRARLTFCQSARSLQGLFLLLGGREVFWCANFLLSSHSFKAALSRLLDPHPWVLKTKMLQKVVWVAAECHTGPRSCTKGSTRVVLLSVKCACIKFKSNLAQLFPPGGIFFPSSLSLLLSDVKDQRGRNVVQISMNAN